MGRHQLARLDTSPYQRELLARGLDRRARGERPNRRMEQGMGYSAAIGMVLMDELAGVCERNEEGERVESLKSSGDEEEVWEIPREEFEATAWSSSLEV